MATEVGKGVVTIEADTKGLGKDIERKMAGESGDVDKGFGSTGQRAGKAFKVAAVAATAGVFAAIALGKEAIGAASDLAEQSSKNAAVFGVEAAAIDKWAAGGAKAFGMSKEQALGAASTYGNLFQAFGLGRKEAADMSVGLTELATDLASFNNTSVEDAISALQSGLTGETEPLKKFGVAISDVRLKNEALRLGLISTTKDALTPAAKAQATYSLVMQDTTLAQGDFERTSDGLANKQRIMAAEFENVKAVIGERLLPVMLAVVSFVASKLIPFLGKYLPKAIDFVRTAIGYLVDGFMGAGWGEGSGFFRFILRVGIVARELFDWFKEQWPKLKAVIAAVFEYFTEKVWPILGEVFGKLIEIGKGVAAAVVGSFDDIWAAVKRVYSFLNENREVLIGVGAAIGVVLVVAIVAWSVATWAQVAALWAQAAAFVAAYAPIVVLALAIGALVAGVIWAYQNVGWFGEAVDTVGRFLRDVVLPIVQSVFGWIRDNIPPIIQGVISTLQWLWEKLELVGRFLRDVVLPIVQSVFGWIRDNIPPIIQGVISTLQWLWDKSELVRAFLAGAFTLGLSVAVGAFGAVRDAAGFVIDKAQAVWDKTEFVRSFLAGAFTVGIGVAKTAFDVLRDAIAFVIEKAQAVWEKTEGLRSFLAGAFSIGLDVAVGAFGAVRDAIQWVIDKLSIAFGWVNRLIEAIGRIKIPKLPGQGQTVEDITGIKIPQSHTGELIQGPPTREVLRVLQGGERVLSRAENAMFEDRRQDGGRGTRGINIATMVVGDQTTADGFFRMANFHLAAA